MGVHGLWELLSPVGTRVSNDHVRGKVLAVDVSIWLTQFVKAMRDAEGAQVRNAHLLGVFRRCLKLLFLSVRPVLVFDGATPALKRRTLASRHAQRERHAAKLRRLAEKLLINQIRSHVVGSALEKKRTSSQRNRQPDANSSRKNRDGLDDSDDEDRIEPVVGNHASHGARTARETSVTWADKARQQNDDARIDSDDEDRIEPVNAKKSVGPARNELPENSATGGREEAHLEDDDTFFANDIADEEEALARDRTSELIDLPYDLDTIDDEALVGLPPAMQSEVFKQIKLQQRVKHRERMMLKQSDPSEFSKTQIEGFLQSTALNRKLSSVRNAINSKSGASQRIASDSGRQFVFKEQAVGKRSGTESVSGSDSDSEDILAPRGDNSQADQLDRNRGAVDLLARIRARRDSAQKKIEVRQESEQQIVRQDQESRSGVGWASRVLEGRGGLSLGGRSALRAPSKESSHDSAMSSEGERGCDVLKSSHLAENEATSGEEHENKSPLKQSDDGDEDDDDDIEWEDGDDSAVNRFDFPDISFGRERERNVDEELSFRQAQSSGKVQLEGGSVGSADAGFHSNATQGVISTSMADDGNAITERNSRRSEGHAISRGERPSLKSDVDCREGDKAAVIGFRELDTKSSADLTLPVPGHGGNRDCLEQGSEDAAATGCNDKAGEAKTAILATRKRRDLLEKSNTIVEMKISHSRSEADGETGADLHSKNGSERKDGSRSGAGQRDASEFRATESVVRTRGDQAEERDMQMAIALSLGNVGPPGASENTEPATRREPDRHSVDPEKTACAHMPLDARGPEQSSAESELKGPTASVVQAKERTQEQDLSRPEVMARSQLAAVPKRNYRQEREESGEEEQAQRTAAISQSEELDNGDDEGDTPRHFEAAEMSTARMQEIRDELALEAREIRKEQTSHEGAAESVSDEMYSETRDLLKLFGIPYLEAPTEAEAQCAFLDMENVVDGVITEDSDAFLFGAKTVYRRLFSEGKFAEAYEAQDIKASLGLDREQLIRLAYLLGSDYTPGVRGVGVVNSMEVLEAFPGEQGLEEFREWTKQVTVFDQEPAEEVMKGTSQGAIRRRFCWKHRNMKRNWEIRDGFPSPAVAEAYRKPHVDTSTERFKWRKIDFAGLGRFCWEKFGWERERFDETIGPLQKILTESAGMQQRRIDEFFKPHRFAKIRSERLQTAVRGIAGENAKDLMASLVPRPRKRKSVPISHVPAFQSDEDDVEMTEALERAERERGLKRSRDHT